MISIRPTRTFYSTTKPSPASILLAVVLLASTLLAAPATGRQLEPDNLLDLDLTGADLLVVLGTFAGILGVDLDADPAVAGKVTVYLDGVPIDEAIAEVCAVAGVRCVVDEEDAVLRVEPAGGAEAAAETDPHRPDPSDAQAIDMSLRDADLHVVLRAFSRIGGREVWIDPGVETGPVTVDLESVPWPMALEATCDLAGCRVMWGDERIVIAPLGPADKKRRLDASFQDTPLAKVLDVYRGLPLLGAPVTLDVDPRAADERVSVELVDATWSELLDALCREAGCDWTLRIDREGKCVLRVAFHDELLARTVDVEPWRGSLASAAERLGEALELRVRLAPELDPERPVELEARGEPGHAVVTALCDQVDCRWRLVGRTLELAPRIALLRARPARGLRAPRVAARLTSDDGGEIAATVGFSWTRTVQRLGDAERRLALVWLPFGHRGQVLLPLLETCAAADDVLALDPVTLPLDAPWRREAAGLTVRLEPAGADDAVLPPPPKLQRCGAGRGRSRDGITDLVVDFPRLARHRLTLDPTPGSYLLVTPPPRGRDHDPAPVAAVVVLGAHATGALTLALVQPPDADGHVAVERLSLAAGETRELFVPHGDGAALELRLGRGE